MGLTHVFSGLPDLTGNVLPCKSYLVVIPIDENGELLEDEDPFKPIVNKPFLVRHEGQAHPVDSDAKGYLTLGFDTATGAESAAIQVKQRDKPSLGRLGTRESIAPRVWRVYVYFSDHWKLILSVWDRRPPGITAEPIRLKQAEVVITWPTGKRPFKAKTGASGEDFVFDKMDCGTEYSLAVNVPGAVEEHSTITIGAPAGPQTLDGALECELKVNLSDAVVEVKVMLAFEKVLIVGEGTNFRYATPLAEKFIGSAKVPRKWIFASQYDVDAPVRTVETLYVYRAADGPGGQFDATSAWAWLSLAALHGDDFAAVIFNNPHPGYGMHKAEVVGVELDDATIGSYISVHSLGSDRKLSADAVSTSEANRFRALGDKATATGQRAFLQGTIGVITDGTATLGSYEDTGRVSKRIREVFAPQSPYVDNSLEFKAIATHYTPIARTIGLKEFLLKKYAEHGVTILKGGGSLYINGSTSIKDDLEDAGLYGEGGFESKGLWAKHEIYYVNYQTNFTSPTIHPSWFSKVEFDPEEPKLDKARTYELKK